MKRSLFWLLVAATSAVYAVMVGWSLPAVSAAAGGMVPFDMRPAGYTFEEAKAFLAAPSPEGQTFYRDVQHKLDIVYPPLIAATLLLSLAALLPPRWGRWRWLAVSPTIFVAIFDWAENAAVAALLEAGAEGITPEMIAQASRWSVLKAGVSTVAFTALLAALAWRGWVMIKRRRTRSV